MPPLEVNGDDDCALFREVEHRRRLQRMLSIEREASSIHGVQMDVARL